MAYEDSRLVDLYDEDNPDGPDHDFYRALADELSAEAILDLGCGTGMLTTTLARPGRVIVGIDPSASMLSYARNRPRAGAVQWVEGDSRDIPSISFDYAVMTGNVAQHIHDDEWSRTLRDLRHALRPGATLAFESRNPVSRAWEEWTSAERTTRDTKHGPLVEWMSASEVKPGAVRIQAHNLFTLADETLVEEFDLFFRDRIEIAEHLEIAGFEVAAVYGDWNRTPFSGQAPVMVFIAHAR